MKEIKVIYEAPTPEEYLYMRDSTGLSPRDIEAARIGLKNSVFAIVLRINNKIIGMGRIVGDGGATFLVSDVAVLPEYQGNGLGKTIMSHIEKYIIENIDRKSYVGIVADRPAEELYAQFGFNITEPSESLLMKYGTVG